MILLKRMCNQNVVIKYEGITIEKSISPITEHSMSKTIYQRGNHKP